MILKRILLWFPVLRRHCPIEPKIVLDLILTAHFNLFKMRVGPVRKIYLFNNSAEVNLVFWKRI